MGVLENEKVKGVLWNAIGAKIDGVVAWFVDWYVAKLKYKYLFRDWYLLNRVYFYFGFRVITKKSRELEGAERRKGLAPAAYMEVYGDHYNKAKGGKV